ncbi:MAG: carbamoyl phosphate synthase-like protein [Burkholderiales bacterium]|nr:carbamoyl phosphate synthase-like protein [Burkholderiales bacterium]
MQGSKRGERVLVLGDYRQTITVVRSLARAGYQVILGTGDPDSFTARSRYVAGRWHYEGSSAQHFLTVLEAWLRAERPEYVFTVGETPLRRVIGEADRFAPLAIWANADPGAVAACFDKRRMYALAAGLGVPSLPWQPFADAQSCRQAAREMGFPVVVKRKDSSAQVRERKALICDGPTALDAFLADIATDPDPSSLVLQKFGVGRRHNCHIAAADGRLVAFFQQKVLRTDEPDDTGIGVCGVSAAPSAALREYCERITRSLAYTGIGCIQFLVDEASGAVAFLEFNARMDSTAVLPYQLGYDFPLLALRLADYASKRAPCPAPLAAPYRAGRAYHWLYGDIRAWLEAARRSRSTPAALAAWALRSAWEAANSYHLTWELRDPLPTLYLYWRSYARHRAKRFLPQPA